MENEKYKDVKYAWIATKYNIRKGEIDMKKKFVTLMLSMIVAASVAGCGGKDKTDESAVNIGNDTTAVSEDVNGDELLDRSDDVEEVNGDELLDAPDSTEGEAPVAVDKENVNYLDILEERPLTDMVVLTRKDVNIPVNILMPPEEYVCEDYQEPMSYNVYMYGNGSDEKIRVGMNYADNISLRNRKMRGEGEVYGSYTLFTQESESEYGYNYIIHIIEDDAKYGAEIAFSTPNLDYKDVSKEMAEKNLEYIREQLKQ